MSFIYVWQSSNLDILAASVRFEQVLARQCKLYGEALGHQFRFVAEQIDTLFVGQIDFDLGVREWTPRVRDGEVGLAWSGVCENFLGARFDAAQVRAIIATAEHRPKTIAEWSGRFCLCSWNKAERQVLLTTGATETQTFWHTEGPHGWAAGNRALPLLELVGCPPRLDRDAAGLLLGFGYLAGDTALFAGVDRLHARRQVRLAPGARPAISTYISLAEYLHVQERQREQNIRISAERVVERVGRQIKHSAEPRLLLTGGRDSRCIAAAAARTGFAGPARTAGHKDYPDVKVAAQVAAALNIRHELSSADDDTSALGLMVGAIDRVRLWSTLSEGLATVRQMTSLQGFLRGEQPHPQTKRQLFHGLHAFGVERPRADAVDLDAVGATGQARMIISSKLAANLLRRPQLDHALESVFERIDSEADGMYLTLGQWLNLFYWQNRCLHWGQDMMSVRLATNWCWNPLIDRDMIRAAWTLSTEDKMSKKFIEDITLLLAPELNSVGYNNKSSGSTLSTLKKTVRRLLTRLQVHGGIVVAPVSSRARQPVDANLARFWDATIFSKGDHAWHALIDEATLREVAQKEPSSNLLWNVATVELVAQTHCVA